MGKIQANSSLVKTNKNSIKKTNTGNGRLLINYIFDPKEIQGLSLWLKADAGVTLDGSNVTAWADQSGNGKNGIADVGSPQFVSSALNGKPAIGFNGTNARITGASPMQSTTGTIIIVGKHLAEKFAAVMYEQYDGYDTFGFYRNSAPSSTLNIYNNATLTSQINVGLVFGIFTAILDGFNSQICINGSVNAQGDAGGFTSNGPYYLSYYAANNEYTNMQIAEVVVYNRAITTAERQKVETYLNEKYSIY
jgi:hypothetical protein